MAMYGKLEYWEERYTHSGESASYEWLRTYGDLRHLLAMESLMGTKASQSGVPPYFPPYEKCRVLILGCGNGTFAEDMRNDGWCGEIVNVDFSSVVIDQMKQRYGKESQKSQNMERLGDKLKFVCADITDGLPFADESFDLIVCKGTMDAILCGIGSTENAKKVVAECARVLANGYGCFFLVSHSNPDSRVEFLEHDNDISHYWKEVSTIPIPRHGARNGSKMVYAYICRKRWIEFGEQKGCATSKPQIMEENAAVALEGRLYKSQGY